MYLLLGYGSDVESPDDGTEVLGVLDGRQTCHARTQYQHLHTTHTSTLTQASLLCLSAHRRDRIKEPMEVSYLGGGHASGGSDLTGKEPLEVRRSLRQDARHQRLVLDHRCRSSCNAMCEVLVCVEEHLHDGPVPRDVGLR